MRSRDLPGRPGADVEQRGFVLGRIDGVVDAVELREVAAAVDVAGAEAAGIDAHDVEVLGDVVGQGEGELGGEAGRTRSRAARVDEQGADAVTAGGDPGDAQGEGVALGLVVVHRHVESGALGVAAAFLPVERVAGGLVLTVGRLSGGGLVAGPVIARLQWVLVGLAGAGGGHERQAGCQGQGDSMHRPTVSARTIAVRSAAASVHR